MIILERIRDTGNVTMTLGSIQTQSQRFEFAAIEPSWINNVKYVSCIPEGRYIGKKHHSPTHGHCILIQGVTNREHILMHAGNFYKQTEGCIMPGERFAYVNDDHIIDVASSKAMMDKMMAALPDEFAVYVRRHKRFQAFYTERES